VVTLAQAWNLAQPQRWGGKEAGYDTVIVDAPASGHALGMLRTPRTFGDIARVGTVRRQADRVRSLLLDPERTGYVTVALPEEMPVTETLELESQLEEEVGMGPAAIVANGLLSQRFSAAELEQLAAPSPNGGPPEIEAALDAARLQGSRARAQQGQLRRLRRGPGPGAHASAAARGRARTGGARAARARARAKALTPPCSISPSGSRPATVPGCSPRSRGRSATGRG
jgi:Oxyanion-translocating ATPase